MCLLDMNALTLFKRIKKQYWLFLPESILVTGSKSNQIQIVTWIPWSMTQLFQAQIEFVSIIYTSTIFATVTAGMAM